MKVTGQIYAVTIQAIGHNTHNAAVLFVVNWYYKKQPMTARTGSSVSQYGPSETIFGQGIGNSGFIKGDLLSGFSSKSKLSASGRCIF